MKKTFYSLLAVLSLSVAAQAQTKGNIEMGINAGVNFTSVSGTNYGYWGSNTSESSTSFNVAASLDFYFSDRWSLKVKGIYDRKGWDSAYITLDDGQDYATNVDMNYITVPVMANWHFGSKRNWYLNFGPYVGFLTNAKETRFDTDLKDNFNTTDAGLAYGIGVKIPVSNQVKLFFEYEGQSGLSDIYKDNYDGSVTTNRGAINVGINFLLK
ncbi:MAG: porin family protein [Bacteroidota bacterium]